MRALQLRPRAPPGAGRCVGRGRGAGPAPAFPPPAPPTPPPLTSRVTATRATAPDAAPAAPAPAGAPRRGLTYTQHEGNSWEATFEPTGVCGWIVGWRMGRGRGGQRLAPVPPPSVSSSSLSQGTTILVDPWLVGELTFGDTPWLYKGSKKALPTPDLAAVCARAAAILISQGLPDHAHGPTLAALPCKSKPVVCSAAAEGVVRGAGFTDVTVLRHGDTATLANGALTVTATQGALVGPPWSERECGFVVEVKGEGKESPPIRLYYEPHCDAPADTLAAIGTVDVVVTPAASQRLAGYPLVMGDENAVATARALNPAVVVPLTNADFTATGPLAAVIQQVGDEAGLQAKLTAAGLRARVVGAAAPGAGRAIEL